MELINFDQEISLKGEQLDFFVQMIKANTEQIIRRKDVLDNSKKTYWKSIRGTFFAFLDGLDELDNPRLILRRYKEYLQYERS